MNQQPSPRAVIWYATAHQSLAESIAAKLDLPCIPLSLHHFPDGESKVTLPAQTAESIILVLDLSQPNPALIELLLISNTLRQQHSHHITLIAPYLPYMRQDIEFNPGEVVSQRVIGQWLGTLVDQLVTVDPHLHRISQLEQVIPDTTIHTLTAAELVGRHIAIDRADSLLFGPDSESEQWVKRAASAAGTDFLVASKIRHGDRHVSVELPAGKIRDRHVVIYDDMSSTGHTLAQAAGRILQAGARSVDTIVTHALLNSQAMSLIQQSGVSRIESTNTIPHTTNTIDISTLLASTLQ